MTNEWQHIDFSDIDSPALIIDRDKVEYNIQLAIKYAGGTERLRPHVKTHKILEVAKMQIAAGINKFKCATIAEAEMLGMAGAEDVLIAYPVQGPKIDRVLGLINKFPKTRFSVLIDNIDTAKIIDAKFENAGKKIDVYIDINNGENRTGIILDKISDLFNLIIKLPRINLIGLHCYDGHINMPSLEERTNTCRKEFEGILGFRIYLQTALNRGINIIAGGTPSFFAHAKYHDVECSPGTFIFWDEGYAGLYKEQQFKKAAVLITRVISKINVHTFCLDLGHKSVASEFPFPRVAFIHPNKFKQTGHSEEHLVIKSKEANALSVGQILMAYPYHICPTVARYDRVQVVSKGTIVDEWEVIARKRKITI